MALRIENVIATPSRLVIYFSESLRGDTLTALQSASLTVSTVDPAGLQAQASVLALSAFGSQNATTGTTWEYNANEAAVVVTPNWTAPAVGSWLMVEIESSTTTSGAKAAAAGSRSSGPSASQTKKIPESLHFFCRVVAESGSGGAKGGPNGNGHIRESVSDLQSYAVLTQEMPAGGVPSSPRPGSAGTIGGTSALGMAADKAIREVLSWRAKTDDSKGFLGALNQAFDIKQVEGHTEWSWTPRSYTVQTDMGAVTGAQASIYTRAKVALDQSLPLLDGLYALYPNVEPEDLATAQSVVRSQFTALVNEFGVVGGPRTPRVDELFELLLGDGSPTNPEHLKRGSLFLVKQRFGLERRYVNTIDDEQNLTNYLILADYVIGLKQSWNHDKKFFIRGSQEREPFFGTQLVLISRALDVVAQGVQDAYFAMDSVFMSDAERQTTLLSFAGLSIWIPDRESNGPRPYTFHIETSGLYVAELLDWVDRSVSDELPALLQDAGKDGLDSFRASTDRLRKFVHGAAHQPHDARGLPPGFHTPRVKRALKLLADGLDEAYLLAFEVRKDDLTPELTHEELRDIREYLERHQNT